MFTLLGRWRHAADDEFAQHLGQCVALVTYEVNAASDATIVDVDATAEDGANTYACFAYSEDGNVVAALKDFSNHVMKLLGSIEDARASQWYAVCKLLTKFKEYPDMLFRITQQLGQMQKVTRYVRKVEEPSHTTSHTEPVAALATITRPINAEEAEFIAKEIVFCNDSLIEHLLREKNSASNVAKLFDILAPKREPGLPTTTDAMLARVFDSAFPTVTPKVKECLSRYLYIANSKVRKALEKACDAAKFEVRRPALEVLLLATASIRGDTIRGEQVRSEEVKRTLRFIATKSRYILIVSIRHYVMHMNIVVV